MTETPVRESSPPFVVFGSYDDFGCPRCDTSVLKGDFTKRGGKKRGVVKINGIRKETRYQVWQCKGCRKLFVQDLKKKYGDTEEREYHEIIETCGYCGGRGFYFNKDIKVRCNRCNGRGEVVVESVFVE